MLKNIETLPTIPYYYADLHAYENFPDQRWVYFKPLLYDCVGTPYGIYPKLPKEWPILVKPAINLEGLAAGVGLAFSETQLELEPGKIWMPILEGDVWSIDINTDIGLASNGQIARGVHTEKGIGYFRYWERANLTALTDQQAFIMSCVLARLRLPHMVVNFEFIADTLIEMHLRPSHEFRPLFREKCPFRYARPLYGLWPSNEGDLTDRIVAAIPDEIPERLICIGHNGLPELTAAGLCRYAVIYGDDLDALLSVELPRL